MRQAKLFFSSTIAVAASLLTSSLMGISPESVSSSLPPARSTRSIFMNGTDISSARSQELKNVDIRINERGDVFIEAPQYQVQEEDTYIPLSKYAQGSNQSQPQHKPAQELKSSSPLAPNLSPNKPATSAGSDTGVTGSTPASSGTADKTAGKTAANTQAPSTNATDNTKTEPNSEPALMEKPGSKIDAAGNTTDGE